VTFLPAKTFDLRNGHSFNAELCERFFHLFELERFNDGLQFFHVAVTLASRGALQPARNALQTDTGGSKANRSTRSHSNCPTRMQSRIFEIVCVILSGGGANSKDPAE
jgi:hypothetical protein